MIGIPTGPPKAYALLHMVASLQLLNYSNLEIHWSVTRRSDVNDKEGKRYVSNLKKAMKISTIKAPWYIHETWLTAQQKNTPYQAVVSNRAKLRGEFLDGEAEYFFMVGGDNPPYRNAIEKLMTVDADVVYGVSYQRPTRDRMFPGSVYPMMWTYAWMMKDLERFPDLEPELVDQLKMAFLNTAYLVPIYHDPGWMEKEVIYDVTGGDGNCLIRRRVLERIGWRVPVGNYHSEDIHFGNWVNLLGFKTAVYVPYHVPHFHEGGAVY